MKMIIKKSRLQKKADRDILNKDKEKLRKEIIKLKKMINK